VTLARASASKTKRPGGWSTVRKVLDEREHADLIALLKELFDLGGLPRDVIETRCLSGANHEALFDKCRDCIVRQFYPARGDGKLKLTEALKAIKEFRTLTGDSRGTAELLFVYVETGTRYAREFGDLYEAYYNGIERGLYELVALIEANPGEFHPAFADRLEGLVKRSKGIGWGFHDNMEDVVGRLNEKMSGRG